MIQFEDGSTCLAAKESTIFRSVPNEEDLHERESATPSTDKIVNVILPCFNEQHSIRPLLSKVIELSAQLPEINLRIWFVDDGSSDSTWLEIKSASLQVIEWLSINGIRLPQNLG